MTKPRRGGTTLLRTDDSGIRDALVRVRGQNVLLDEDLAPLYGVEVRVLNQAVARNAERFPPDFMFVLTPAEATSLRSQIVILKNRRGEHRKYLPRASTEQGIAMLSSVLRIKRAIQVNIEIMRAFVRLRRILDANDALRKRLDGLEHKYDGQFRIVFQVIRELMNSPDPPRRTIGFRGNTAPTRKLGAGRRKQAAVS